MPYRRSGEPLQVRTAIGRHRISTTADGVEVRAPDNSYVYIASRAAILHSRARREHLALDLATTRIVVARNVQLDDVTIWLEADTVTGPLARRLFGLSSHGALSGRSPHDALSAAFRQLQAALRAHRGDIVRATELGTGRHRMLLVERADRHVLYAARLFREHAPLAVTIFADGHVAQPRWPAAPTRRHAGVAVSVAGDDVRISDNTGADLARFAFPWFPPEDRAELARRLTDVIAAQSS